MFRLPTSFMVLTIAATLSACGTSENEPRDKSRASPEQEAAALPVADPPLDRKALLLAIYEAASARAAGIGDLEAQRSLNGKRFEIRIRFGCPGEEAGGSRNWTFDEETRTLRFRIEPDVALTTPLIRQLAWAGIENVQGFRIRRPWMFGAACPASIVKTPAPPEVERARAAKPAATPAYAPAPYVAIAQFFSAEDPRTHLGNGRPLTSTTRIPDGEAPSRSGYDLLVAGRLEPLDDGRVIACTSKDPDLAPDCVVSARFDRISLAAPNGASIAEWSAR